MMKNVGVLETLKHLQKIALPWCIFLNGWIQQFYCIQVNDVLGNMEKEKYELQKMHTQNIQELLDDTNQRLQSMEDEYNSQTQATVSVIATWISFACFFFLFWVKLSFAC